MVERFLALLRILLVRKIAIQVRGLVREARGSHNHAMILYQVTRHMRRLGPDLAPYLIREIIMGASRHEAGYAEFLQHMGDVRGLASHTGNDFMSEVLQRSRRLQLDEVVELLTDTPPQRVIYHTEEVEKRNPAQDYIPLGVRKSLARRTHPGTLEALLTEQDPQVVRNLLTNPRTTEEMVVKMAALRPTSEAVLETIASHERWLARYKVRKALVFNPYAPTRASHALLPTLMMKDLMDVSLSQTLHGSLRAAARRFILHRVNEMSASEKQQFMERYAAVFKRIFLPD